MNLLLEASLHLHRRDAGDRFQLAPDLLFGQLPELKEGVPFVGVEADSQDGIEGWIVAQQEWFFRVVG